MSVSNPSGEIPVISTGVNTLFKFLHVSDARYIKDVPADPTNPSKVFINGDEMLGRSVFLYAVDGMEDPSAIQSALSGVFSSFTPITTILAVKTTNQDLYGLATWMNGFSAATPHAEIVAKRSSVSALSETDEETLWDNLFYQTIKGTSSGITDAIILMLRANAFIVKLNATSVDEPFDEPTTNSFIEVANAVITIPSNLVARTKTDSISGSFHVDAVTMKHLKNASKGAVAKSKVRLLKGHLKEIYNLVEAHRQLSYEAYSTAIATYNTTVAGLIESAEVDPETGEPIVDYPLFEYTIPDPFATEFLSSNLSEPALATLTQFKRDHDTNIIDVIGVVEATLSKLNVDVFDSITAEAVPLVFKGVQIPVVDKPSNNSAIIEAVAIEGEENLYQLYLTQYFEDPATKIVALTVDNAVDFEGNPINIKIETVEETNNFITFSLFENGAPAGTYTLTGTFKAQQDDTVYGYSNVLLNHNQPLFKTMQPLDGYDGVPGDGGTKIYGVSKIGVGDFMRVEQEICCYVPGEVSHIENIMAREYKERATRQLTRTETTTEETTEREVENLSDTISTERHDLHSEVSRTLQEQRANQFGGSAGLSGKIGTNLSFHADANFSHSNSSGLSSSFNEAESIAKEVVERALERVVEKMTYKRTSRMLREFEETNKHGFDNRVGSRSVTGVYRWVDKIYKNRLMNYGKRLVYNFAVPEPARNFKHWVKKNSSNSNSFVPKPPVAPISPDKYGIKNYTDIDRSNYAYFAGKYGIEIEPCVPQNIQVGKSFSEMPSVTGAENKISHRQVGGYKFDFELPENYMCTTYRFSYTSVRSGSDGSPEDSRVSIAGNNHPYTDTWYDAVGFTGTNSLPTGSLPVSISTHGVGGFGLNIIADCWLVEEIYFDWQRATYMKIMQAYHEQLQKYRDAQAEYEAWLAAQTTTGNAVNDYRLNPLEARNIEQRELKRLCIELMLAPWGISLGKDLYKPDLCPVNFSINRNTELDSHAAMARFMEEAFDWSIMAYMLQPYYWAHPGGWSSIIKEKSSNDPLFEAFIQSGMANVSVPVRPGFETQVLYFLDTGTLPISKELIPMNANYSYTKLVANLKLEKPVRVGETWQTRVPTALTIIQDHSAPLNQNGLPCICEDGTPIATGSSLLSGLDATSGSVALGKQTSFTFDKHSSLNTIHIGKLIMNDGDGLAKVYQLSPGLTAQLGQYIIKLEDLADLTAESKITFTTKTDLTVSFIRATWRNGETPTNALDELNLIRTHILSLSSLSFITPTIVDDKLVLNETTQESTKVSLTAFPSGSLEIVTPSQPSSAAAPAGFPLGKLVAIENGKAVISSSSVETYELESEFTVDHSLFNSGAEIDFYSENAFQAIFDHLIMPAADGKVKPLGLTLDDVNHDFENVYRNQFIGVAIASAGLEVTVMRLPALSFMFHIMRRAVRKGVFSVSGLM